MFLTLPGLPHYLLTRGLVDPDDLVQGNFIARDAGRRNRNFAVQLTSRPGLFVKQVPIAIPETINALQREALCYRLAGSDPNLRAIGSLIVPFRDYDPQRHAITLELIADAENLNEYHYRCKEFPDEIGKLQGRALATLHISADRVLANPEARAAFSQAPPWVLSMHRRAESIMPAMSMATQEVVAALRQDPILFHGLDSLLAGWQRTTLIHGDIKWDNFIHHHGPDGAPALRVIDWELADVGDPAWDLACLFTSYITFWLFSLPIDPSQPDPAAVIPHASRPISAVQPAVQAAWREYLAVSGIGPAGGELLRRTMRYVGGRLVLTAFESLNRLPKITPVGLLLLRLATAVLGSPDQAADELFGLSLRDPSSFATAPPVARTGAVPAPSRDVRSAVETTPACTGLRTEALPDDVRQRLEPMIAAVTITSPTSFRFADLPAIEIGASPTVAHAPRQPGAALVEAMIPVLYQECYARTFSGVASALSTARMTEQANLAPDASFVAQLSAANTSRGRWDPAWKVYLTDPNGAIHVQKGEAFHRALPGEYGFSVAPGRVPAIGDVVDLLLLRESTGAQSGFYFAFGDTPSSDYDDANLSRFYFHVRPESAPWLLGTLGGELNRFCVPFRIKFLLMPSLYDRADPVVLYISRRYAAFALRVLATFRDQLPEHLMTSVPLFTRPLAPGLGVADEPRTGESFGQARVRLVAEGIVDAWLAGSQTLEARLNSVRDRFERGGLRLAEPYLNDGLANVYAWPMQGASS